MTTPEGQTARDVHPEDEGIPEVSQDDSPTQTWNEDPEFAPLPGERPGASTDFGTTAFEQSQGESLSGRLDREEPDVQPGVRAAEDPQRATMQLEQDTSTSSAVALVPESENGEVEVSCSSCIVARCGSSAARTPGWTSGSSRASRPSRDSPSDCS